MAEYQEIGRLLGQEEVFEDPATGYKQTTYPTIMVFSCMTCAALVADQQAHDRAHSSDGSQEGSR